MVLCIALPSGKCIRLRCILLKTQNILRKDSSCCSSTFIWSAEHLWASHGQSWDKLLQWIKWFTVNVKRFQVLLAVLPYYCDITTPTFINIKNRLHHPVSSWTALCRDPLYGGEIAVQCAVWSASIEPSFSEIKSSRECKVFMELS